MTQTISNEIHSILREAKSIAAIYPERAYDMSAEALELATSHQLELEKGYGLLGMSFACRAKSDISPMLDLAYKALEIFDRHQEMKGQIRALNLIGIAYFYSAMYEQSLKFLLQVISLLKHNQDDFLLSCVLNNIGEVYRESSSYNKALDYFEQALKVSDANNFRFNKASILGNIGEIFFSQKKYDEALTYYNQSYDLLMEENDMVNLGDVEHRLGKIYFVVGNLVQAENFFRRALERLSAIDNKYYAIDVLMNLGQLIGLRDFSAALSHYVKALRYAESINAKKKIMILSRKISEHYELEGDYRSALDYFKEFCRVNEEITASTLGSKLEILNIELRYIEVAGKFEQIQERLEKEIAYQQHELKKIKEVNAILEKKAYEDELTGIPNRRSINLYLNELMESALESTLESTQPMAMFMMDIDHFKKFNDYWGHSEGDGCIKQIAGGIKKLQREGGDLFGRYGGEEFVFFAPNLSYKSAEVLGHTIRDTVEKLGLYYVENGCKKPVTISVGGTVGTLQEFGSVASMMELADAELYKAKALGRNQTQLRDLSAAPRVVDTDHRQRGNGHG
ncbi:MAG: diguanylate cyclase [Acidaminobacter sp.]|uniref:GGDEF domain-containing protein n=1 Tax=Acidaminobacter sp. TaxID=1872102 RepID=UPI00137E1F73|nr:tetratricopeptide repeat-containing diguanylate cyclase [Acidaminobacter sp.]MZQ99428.1 diguanylate cyclase [Acidaminobacter sp.]